MDIKKLNTHISETHGPRQSASSSGIPSSPEIKKQSTDQVSIDQHKFKQNEALFARTEYDKQSQAAFDKLRAMKTELNAYEQAKSDPSADPSKTKIGQMLDSPDVWEDIAKKILNS
ncbi:hypothetical protein QLX67_05775 [Balneolaceae bacterium ANBcel3]|nr:hypothetical protein [Balneolaceae bacterium ANBcel3]